MKNRIYLLLDISVPLTLLLTLVATFFTREGSASRLQTNAGELFTYKIEPELFNWTKQVLSEQFRYRPSLKGYPDLPSWMRYMYSNEYHAGFLYGTPPISIAGKSFSMDIVALNRRNYETRHIVISIFVAHKFPTPNVVQMKIDNLNWVHLMDPGRVENLRNIFRKELWPQSAHDLSVVFMESAVNMGARLPLKPQQHEGVVVHLGSFARFSSRLKDLQEEVRPLYKLPTCTYKRTSVQKLFENAGFKLDWCAFKMVDAESTTEILHHNLDNKHETDNDVIKPKERWIGIAHDEVPSRNYIDEFAFAFAIPGVIFAVLIGILSAALCFYHENFSDPHSEYFFQNIFHICEESCTKQESQDSDNEFDVESVYDLSFPLASSVQMVECGTHVSEQQPVPTVESVKEQPGLLLDTASLRSQSPSNPLTLGGKDHSYVRPQPPPYKSGTLEHNSADM